MADPILNVTFGDGNNNPGPSLPIGKTTYRYTPDLCPKGGEYTIARNNLNCAENSNWNIVYRDHTFQLNGSALEGYLMLVDASSSRPEVFYTDTVNNLCSNNSYLLSAWVAMIGKCINTFESANILFRVETKSGETIKISGPGYQDWLGFDMLRHASGFYFTMPPGETSVIIKIVNKTNSSGNCGNKIALDDIQLRPTGPKITIGLANQNPEEWVASVCFSDNKSISITGIAGSGYLNPAFQWQQSIDEGLNWQDITRATNLVFTGMFSQSDTFLFRMRASEDYNIANPFCSSVSNVVKVEVDTIPVNFKAANNSPVCAGQNLIFNAGGGATYIWTGPDEFSETSPFPHIYYSTLADSGMYYVQVKTLGGCTATDSTYVTMIGTDVKTASDTSICKGQVVPLNVNGGEQYSWSPVNSLSDPTLANPTATPEITTTYNVRVTDKWGCTNSGAVVVKLLNSIVVKAAFASTNYLCRPSDTATFIDMSQGMISSWDWDFSNGGKSSLRNPPTQNYVMANSSKEYPVRLVVTDTAGCVDTTYHSIKVADNCYIAVPSAFTPNGDGLNDYLYPLNAYKATNLLFKIYNRSGQLIFETRDWTRKWNGTFRGVQQSADTFIWTLDYKDERNKNISLRGATLLIR